VVSRAENQLKAILHKGKGVAVALWGEAGVGKTYRVGRLLQGVPCPSLSLHAAAPLASLVQTLPKPKKLSPWAEHNLKRLVNGEAVERANLVDSLGALLAGLAPFILHLEDIHEVDQERKPFIEELARLVLRVKGVGFVVTSRLEPPAPFTAVKLGPLSRQETEALLERELKTTLPQGASGWIYHKAAGNPLYSLEYLRYLTRQGFLWSDGQHWHWRKPEGSVLPVTVEALIEQRLSRAKAEPSSRDVLESKALLPFNTNHEVWQSLASVHDPDFQTALRQLSQLGIFSGDDFAHPLFREVTLNAMSAERKRDLARCAVNVFQNQPEQAALFVEAAGLEPTTTLTLLKTAAARARGRNEVEAAGFLAKAVTYANGDERGTLALEAATQLKHHDAATALRLAEVALTLFPKKTEIIDLLMELYAALKQRQEASQVVSLLSAAEEQGEKGLHRQLRFYSLFNEHQAALELVARHASLLASDDADVLDDLIWTMIYTDQAEKAKTLIEHALTLPGLTPYQRARCHYARALTLTYFHADDRAAELELRQALAGFREANNLNSVVAALHAQASLLQNLGAFQEALPRLEEAAELSIQLGNRSVWAATTVALADQLRCCGEYERAEELYLESLAILRRHDDAVFLMDCLDNLAALYRDWPVPHGATLALKYGREALSLAHSRKDARQIVSSSATLALALVQTRNLAEALALADEALSLAQTPQQTLTAQLSKMAALKALGHEREALELGRAAEKLAQQIGRPYQLQLVGLELDRLSQDVERARARMLWLKERGLMHGVNIARRYFPELAGQEQPTATKSHLRLEVLGSLQVTSPTASPVRGRKRQELLALLLEARIAGRRDVPKLTLLDTLYAEEDELKAGSSLTSVIHSLRETLGESAIVTTANGYALGSCTSDAEQFLQTGDTSLWRGLYLEGLEVESESRVRDTLYLALHDQAAALLEAAPQEAARATGLLVEAEPYNTDYLKTYLTALRLSGSHGKLARHYQEAKTRLLEVGEGLPATWQSFLEQAK
jgi:tetratricopeptide (TPR) repeat protein